MPTPSLPPHTVIPIHARSAFGVTRFYVTDRAQAQAISTLTGALTLESRHVVALRALGFALELASNPNPIADATALGLWTQYNR